MSYVMEVYVTIYCMSRYTIPGLSSLPLTSNSRCSRGCTHCRWYAWFDVLPEYAKIALHSRQTSFLSTIVPLASAGKPKCVQTLLLVLGLPTISSYSIDIFENHTSYICHVASRPGEISLVPRPLSV